MLVRAQELVQFTFNFIKRGLRPNGARVVSQIIEESMYCASSQKAGAALPEVAVEGESIAERPIDKYFVAHSIHIRKCTPTL